MSTPSSASPSAFFGPTPFSAVTGIAWSSLKVSGATADGAVMRRRSYRWHLRDPRRARDPRHSTSCATADSVDTTLHVLVTNDDGVAAPGIDLLVRTLDHCPTSTCVSLPRRRTTAARATVATATVRDRRHDSAAAIPPSPSPASPPTRCSTRNETACSDDDLVVSGVNWGENLGPTVELSGTIGAARTAARLGLPALAVSQGNGDPPDFAAGAEAAARWVQDHRDQILERHGPGGRDQHQRADVPDDGPLRAPRGPRGDRGPRRTACRLPSSGHLGVRGRPRGVPVRLRDRLHLR